MWKADARCDIWCCESKNEREDEAEERDIEGKGGKNKGGRSLSHPNA